MVTECSLEYLLLLYQRIHTCHITWYDCIMQTVKQIQVVYSVHLCQTDLDKVNYFE